MTADDEFLLHLVDVVWGAALEDESVPNTTLGRKLIAKARATFKRDHELTPMALLLRLVRDNETMGKLRARGISYAEISDMIEMGVQEGLLQHGKVLTLTEEGQRRLRQETRSESKA